MFYATSLLQHHFDLYAHIVAINLFKINISENPVQMSQTVHCCCDSQVACAEKNRFDIINTPSDLLVAEIFDKLYEFLVIIQIFHKCFKKC